jgi:hypothetical protein
MLAKCKALARLEGAVIERARRQVLKPALNGNALTVYICERSVSKRSVISR